MIAPHLGRREARALVALGAIGAGASLLLGVSASATTGRCPERTVRVSNDAVFRLVSVRAHGMRCGTAHRVLAAYSRAIARRRTPQPGARYNTFGRSYRTMGFACRRAHYTSDSQRVLCSRGARRASALALREWRRLGAGSRSPAARLACLSKGGTHAMFRMRPTSCALPSNGRTGCFAGGMDLRSPRWRQCGRATATVTGVECGFREQCGRARVRLRASGLARRCGTRTYRTLSAANRCGRASVRVPGPGRAS